MAQPPQSPGQRASVADDHRSLIPLRWLAPLNPLKYDLVIVWNWLDVRSTPGPNRSFLFSKRSSAIENRDVHTYIKATNDQWALRYLGMEPWQTVQFELIRARIIARDGQVHFRAHRRRFALQRFG